MTTNAMLNSYNLCLQACTCLHTHNPDLPMHTLPEVQTANDEADDDYLHHQAKLAVQKLFSGI